MTRRSRIWLVFAAVYTVVNALGAGYAAVMGESLHAGVHVALLLLVAPFAWRLASRRSAYGDARSEESVILAPPGPLHDRLTNLEQSVDAVAIEIERIGEGQRFMTSLFTEKDTPRASDRGAAQQRD